VDRDEAPLEERWDGIGLSRNLYTIGTTFTVCARLWGLLELHGNIREIFVQPKHILWALCFLKVYASQYVLASLLHVDRKTLMRWTWIVVENIHWLHGEVVSSHVIFAVSILSSPCSHS
jgi:hypothetical protein